MTDRLGPVPALTQGPQPQGSTLIAWNPDLPTGLRLTLQPQRGHLTLTLKILHRDPRASPSPPSMPPVP